MIRLGVSPAQGEPFEHPVEGDSVLVGRSSECDLTFADRFLSRRHARIYLDGGRWWVEDLGSRNGTLVNGRRVKGTRVLAEGDEIGISGSTITFGAGAAAAPAVLDSELGDHTIFKPASDLMQQPPTAETGSLSAPAQRYVERLRMLNDVHQALGRSIERDDLLELILQRAFEHLEPEEGAIYLRDAGSGWRRAATRSRSGAESDLLVSETLVREVAEKGLAALVLDLESDDVFGAAQSMLAHGVRSLVAAPLLDGEGSLGMIALNSRGARRQFSEEDMELLVSLASVAALRIRNLELAEEAAERRRLQSELELARQIQVGLLPDALPELDGYQLYGGNVPSRGVSGDYYEVLERTGGECVLLVADVSGKGIAASLLTASLEGLAAGRIEAGEPPEAICEQVSARLFRRTPPAKYATLFLAVLEPASGRLRYANAGHNPALLIRGDGSSEELTSTGVPIGMMPAATYRAAEVALEAGDTLVVYTDGITEAEDPDDREFGLERLAGVCVEHRGEPLDAMARAIEERLEAFARGVPFADDRTLVMLRRLGL